MRTLPPTIDESKDEIPLTVRRNQVDAFLIIQRLQRAVQDRTMTHFKALSLTDITPSQANVLMVLFQRRRPMSARDIHRELGVSEVTISRLVNTLVTHDWVAKTPDPNDGRAALLMPTSKARYHLSDFISVANRLLDETFEGVEANELATLHRTILRIDSNLARSRTEITSDKT